MVLAPTISWFISFASSFLSCEERGSKTTKSKVGFGPGAFHLQSERINHCATRSDIHRAFRCLPHFTRTEKGRDLTQPYDKQPYTTDKTSLK